MKKKLVKRLKLILAMPILLSVMAFSGCKNSAMTVKEHIVFDFFGTGALIGINTPNSFWGTEDKKLAACFSDIEEALLAINAKFSTQSQEGIVYKINAENNPVSCDDEFVSVFNVAKQVHKKSGGLYDPTVKLGVDLWGFSKRYKDSDYQPLYPYDRVRNADNSFNLPDSKYLSAFKTLTDFDAMTITDDGFVVKMQQKVQVDGAEYSQQLDFSGIIKGYATEVIKDIVDSYGYTDYYCSIGTSSMYLSENIDQNIIEITDPNNTASSFASLTVSDKFIAASGVYENNYVIDGVLYHHVLNPETLSPSNTDILSVTLFGKGGAYLDGYSTVVLQLGSKGGVEFIQSASDVISGYIIVTQENKVLTDISDLVFLSDEYELI